MKLDLGKPVRVRFLRFSLNDRLRHSIWASVGHMPDYRTSVGVLEAILRESLRERLEEDGIQVVGYYGF